MRRGILVIGGIILAVVLIVFWKNSNSHEQPDTFSSNTPTQILGITATSTTTPPPTATPELQKQVTCQSTYSSAKKDATTFMNAHKAKNADEALAQISTPTDQDQQDQLDFWLGTDTGDSMRLYQTTSTSYTTKSFSFGSISDRGDDQNYRGTKRCQLTVHESRTSQTTTGAFTEETVTRYIDFSMDESGDLLLTAFRSSKDGAKYSGFN